MLFVYVAKTVVVAIVVVEAVVVVGDAVVVVEAINGAMMIMKMVVVLVETMTLVMVEAGVVVVVVAEEVEAVVVAGAPIAVSSFFIVHAFEILPIKIRCFKGGEKGENEDGVGGEESEFNDEKPKEFYIPPEPSNDEDTIFGNGISMGINYQKYTKVPVTITGDNLPKSIQTFAEANFSEYLLENIGKSGYTQPTPIQKAAIPIVLAKRDLMGCSQTGSGKTAAFLLPIIQDLLQDNRSMTVGKPQVLIVSPTRELAIQVSRKITN